MPGCFGLGSILALHGYLTSEQLGTSSNNRYQQLLALIPQKRVDVPEDLKDPNRYSVGHLDSLDKLRIEARAEVQRSWRAQAQRYNGVSEAARASAKARARSHDGQIRVRTAAPFTALTNLTETEAETETDFTAAETGAETEAGAEPEAEPSREDLEDATREAEQKADDLLATAEAVVRAVHTVAAESLRHARGLLDLTSSGTAEAAFALGCTGHAVNQFPQRPHGQPQCPLREALEAAERKCRDVLVFRCQLRCPLRRRGLFLDELQTATLAARDNAAAQSAPSSSSSAHPPIRSAAADAAAAALPILSLAASGGEPGQKWVSQAMNAHRKEVANNFPGTFLSNCQRTAARRGRTRNQRLRQGSQPEANPQADQDASAEEEVHSYDFCGRGPEAEALTENEPVNDLADESRQPWWGYWGINSWGSWDYSWGTNSWGSGGGFGPHLLHSGAIGGDEPDGRWTPSASSDTRPPSSINPPPGFTPPPGLDPPIPTSCDGCGATWSYPGATLELTVYLRRDDGNFEEKTLSGMAADPPDPSLGEAVYCKKCYIKTQTA